MQKKRLRASSFWSCGASARRHFYTPGLAIITRNYYTKLCTIHWSPYHGSPAKLVQYNEVSSPHSNAKVIEVMKKHLPLICNDQCKSIATFPAEN